MRWLLAMLLAGCAHTNAATMCSESRDLKCMTTPQCTMDNARGCQVCTCSPLMDNTSAPTH